MSSPDTPYVFLAFDEADREYAASIMERLQADGFQVWFGTTQTAHESEWAKQTAEGLEQSHALLALVTIEALRNGRVEREMNQAVSQGMAVVVAASRGVRLPSTMTSFPVWDDANQKEIPVEIATRLRSLDKESKVGTVDDRSLYLQTLIAKYEQWLERYTPMEGVAEFFATDQHATFKTTGTKIDQEFEAFLQDDSGLAAGRMVRRDIPDDIVTILGPASWLAERRAPVFIVGDPGSGKTTSLWRLAIEYARTAEQTPGEPLPIVLALAEWDPTESFLDYIASSVADEHSDYGPLLSTEHEEGQLIFLLDGLDEVRGNLEPGLGSFRSWLRSVDSPAVIVTCREHEFEAAKVAADFIQIKPLDPIRVRRFIDAYIVEPEAGAELFWQLLPPLARTVAKSFLDLGVTAEQLWLSTDRPSSLTWRENWSEWLQMRDDPRGLLTLARTPYLLFMMARLYAADGFLPDNRAQLLRAFVKFLIHQECDRHPETRIDETYVIDTLGESALASQMAQRAPRNSHVLPIGDAMPNTAVLAIGRGAGLLVGGGSSPRFAHELLREYFVARELDRQRLLGSPATDFWPSDSWGEEGLNTPAMVASGLYPTDATPVVQWVASVDPELAAQCITESGAAVSTSTHERLVKTWQQTVTDGNSSPLARVSIGRALGRLDADTRFSASTPSIEWSEPFEVAGHTLQAARFLLVNREFQPFLEDKHEGYYSDVHWPEDWLDWRLHSLKPSPYPLNLSNHPVVYVSWFDAIVYCSWLSRKLNYRVCLLSELEWSAGAASRVPGAPYSYGETFSAESANTRETGVGTPSTPGVFPYDVSKYGMFDIAGNVAEWCANSYDEPGEQFDDDANVAPDDYRAVRGGSYSVDGMFGSRTAERRLRSPTDRARDIGFRVARRAPNPSAGHKGRA